MKRQIEVLSKVILVVVAVIIINVIGATLFFRIDLTSDNRYTLSEVSIETVQALRDTVYFKVFLDGDLPVSFIRMKKETEDMLNEFNDYSNGYIDFEFLDPNDGKEDQQMQTQQFLASHGITPFTIQEKDEDGKLIQRLIFPGAIVFNGDKAVSINLLKNTMGKQAEEAVHAGIQNIEYELLNAIKRVTIKEKNSIAFVQGHGELSGKHIFDITQSLQEYYNVERVEIGGKFKNIEKYATLIIAKPEKDFSDADKFAIDQYIMNGGNVVWLLDFVHVNMDSLAYASAVMALAKPVNIQDQLFRYGVRVNYNVVLDNQCATIPLNVAPAGAPPQFNPAPWYYFPLMRPTNHIIAKNITPVKAEFVSVLDTVNSSKDVKKTVLLTSSKYAKVLSVPVPVSFDILNQQPDGRFFNKFDLVYGVLLEGEFESLFKNRDISSFSLPSGVSFKEKGSSSVQVVIADGDIIRNDIKTRGLDTLPYPLGFDKFTQQTYGNKDFLLNVMNYINNGNDILHLRSRELQIRMLNKNRINEEKVLWQIVNVALPLLLIILFGVVYSLVRKRKYTVR